MFSSLKVFMFFGVAFMLAGDTVLAQQESLEVFTAGGPAEYDIGDPVAVTFLVYPVQVVNLQVTWQGVNITSISGATAPFTNAGNYATKIIGGSALLEVEGTITAEGAWIMARWDRWAKDDLTARAASPFLPTSATAVFSKYKEIFEHPDVYEFFPDVLNAFKDPENQGFQNPPLIRHFADDPKFIRNFYKETDDSILGLLFLDDQFGELFRDNQFHGVVRIPTEIDELVRLIQTLEPRARAECPVLPEVHPEAPKATTLLIVSGYGQEGSPGTLLQPFVVEVRDQYGEALSGVSVTFSVTKGGGTLSHPMARTDNVGRASTSLTLGSSVRANWVVASVAGIRQKQTFTATTTEPPEAPKPTTLARVSGYGQVGIPNTALTPFIVLVRDQHKAPYPGAEVTFAIEEGEGELSPPSAITNTNGYASVTLTLGQSMGTTQVKVSVAEIGEPVIFTTYTEPKRVIEPPKPTPPKPTPTIPERVIEPPKPTPPKPTPTIVERGIPTHLIIHSGDNQKGAQYDSLEDPLVVQVLDQEKKPIIGRAVNFRVVHGSGALSDEIAITDENGFAQTNLTLGSGPGVISVEAEVAGTSLKVNFTAMVSVPPVGVLDSPSVYWIAGGRLYRPAIGSGEEESLVPSVETATSLTVDMRGSKIYWTERTAGRTGRIRSADPDGTGVRDIKDLTSVPLDVIHDAANNTLYLITSSGKIQRINIDGTNYKTDLIVRSFRPRSLAIDAKDLYWTEQTSVRTGEIWRADLDGTSVRRVVQLQSAFKDIAVDATNGKLYLANSMGKIQRINVDGSGFEVDFITGLDKPTDVVVDAENSKLYWIEGYKIRRADLDGNNIEDVLTGRSDSIMDLALGVATRTAPAAPTNALLASVETSSLDESRLFANYPNPFNPETWIPYELSEAADVTVSIYSVNGELVRTLALGHQAASIYQSKSRAAYWDGRNELGEQVASGLYFYTLTAGDFTATRKMLIRK